MNKSKQSKSKNLRQRLLMQYHQDGLLDITVGLTILMLAVVMAFEAVPFIGLVGIPLILYIPIKEKVSIPRIGFVRFEPEDLSKKRMLAFLLLGGSILIVFTLLILLRSNASPGFVELLRNNLELIFAVILAGTLFAIGRFLSNPRFVIYAILSLILVLGLYFVGLSVWMAVGLVGLFMEGIGIYKLVNFLRTYNQESRE